MIWTEYVNLHSAYGVLRGATAASGAIFPEIYKTERERPSTHQ